MLGLFVLGKAAGQSAVMFVVLVASIGAIVISRNKVFKPLIQYLPVEVFEVGSGGLSSGGVGHHRNDNHTGVGGRSSSKDVIRESKEEVDLESQAAAASTGYRGVGSTGESSALAFDPSKSLLSFLFGLDLCGTANFFPIFFLDPLTRPFYIFLT